MNFFLLILQLFILLQVIDGAIFRNRDFWEDNPEEDLRTRVIRRVITRRPWPWYVSTDVNSSTRRPVVEPRVDTITARPTRRVNSVTTRRTRRRNPTRRTRTRTTTAVPRLSTSAWTVRAFAPPFGFTPADVPWATSTTTTTTTTTTMATTTSRRPTTKPTFNPFKTPSTARTSTTTTSTTTTAAPTTQTVAVTAIPITTNPPTTTNIPTTTRINTTEAVPDDRINNIEPAIEADPMTTSKPSTGTDAVNEVIPINETCLQCICQGSGCKFNEVNDCVGEDECGPYKIDYAYWYDAGYPGYDGGEGDFHKCVRDKECAETTVKNYVSKYVKDCNDDGSIDCVDYALIHKSGPEHCSNTWIYESAFWGKFSSCFGFEYRK